MPPRKGRRHSRKFGGKPTAAKIYRSLPQEGKVLWQLASPAQRARVVKYCQRTCGFKDTMKKVGQTALAVLKTVPRLIGINV